jgi:hypothetical protein
MTLGNLLWLLSDEEVFELRPQGFFNVESGRFSITNGFYDPCDCNVENFGNSTCQDCGRGKTAASVTFPAGDGDGIYLAYAIVMPGERPGEKDLTVGLIAIFDYRYEIANFGRNAIENEELPGFPMDLAKKFNESLALTIGTVKVDRTLLIGEKSFGTDSEHAVVDFPGAIPGVYTCVAYCEEVDTTAAGIADRMSRTQGMPREIVEREANIAEKTFDRFRAEEGIDPEASPFPPFVPRAVVALCEGMTQTFDIEHPGTIDEINNVDWKLLQEQFRFRIETSHRSQMNMSAIWQNVLLAREYNRIVGECSDEAALALQFDMRTWLYQGRELGDEDCINALEGFTYEPTANEEIYLYMRRGLQSAAAKYL